MTSESLGLPILFASGNKHKTSEIQALLGERFVVSDLSTRPNSRSPEETGSSFEENALIKAEAALIDSDCPVLADDSGLEVDAMGGAPGIHTARFAGPNATDEQNRAKLLASLRGQTNRSARFVCVLALIIPRKPPQIFRGEIKGFISCAESGSGGFGYDPLFIPEGFSESFATLSSQVKNSISHRAIAVQKLLQAKCL
jgi:XTP/dITP diphosphohydrolase